MYLVVGDSASQTTVKYPPQFKNKDYQLTIFRLLIKKLLHFVIPEIFCRGSIHVLL